MRFSLKSMLIATALVAASCAGLLNANAVWATCFTTGVLLLLLFAIVAAMLRQGQARAYWIGFVVFGVGYFGFATFGEIAANPSVQRLRVQGLFSGVNWPSEPRLLTTQFMLWAESQFQPVRSNQTPGQGAYSLQTPAQGPYRLGLRGNIVPVAFVSNATQSVLTIGHAIFTLLLAHLGGLLGSWLARSEAAAQK